MSNDSAAAAFYSSRPDLSATSDLASGTVTAAAGLGSPGERKKKNKKKNATRRVQAEPPVDRVVALADGFTVRINPHAADDFELLELILGSQEDERKLLQALPRLLAPGDFDRLKEHLRSPESGVVSAVAMGEAFGQIFERYLAGDGKNF